MLFSVARSRSASESEIERERERERESFEKSNPCGLFGSGATLGDVPFEAVCTPPLRSAPLRSGRSVVAAQSGSPAAGSAIGDLAICVFASGLGGLEAYEGTGAAGHVWRGAFSARLCRLGGGKFGSAREELLGMFLVFLRGGLLGGGGGEEEEGGGLWRHWS